MKTVWIVLAAVAFVSLAGVGIDGCSWYAGAVSLEETTKAQYRDNQNRYDAFHKSVVETAQVPAQYAKDFKETLRAEVEGKFGNGGSKAVMQWFQERDLRLPTDLYAKVSDMIAVGRQDFKQGQQSLLDKQRRFGTHLRGVTGKLLWSSMFGFPNEMNGDFRPPRDLDGDGKYTVLDYDIVTSTRTREAFSRGVDEPVKVF